MILITILVTFGFSLLAFLPQSSLYSNYYLYLLNLCLHHKLWFIVLVISLLGYFKLVYHKNSRILTLQTITLGILASGVFIYLLAFIELNFLSAIYRISPQRLGITTDIHEVNSLLLKYRLAPQIITTNKNAKDTTYALAAASSGRNTFFARHVVPKIPPQLIFTTFPNQSNIILVDDTLIISQITPSETQILSPTLGYLLVQNYFTQLPIKHFPKVDLVSEDDYKKFRRDDFSSKLALVDEYQKSTQASIATYSATVSLLQKNITILEGQIQHLYVLIDKDLNNRQPKYDQVSQLNKNLDELKSQVADHQSKLTDAETLARFFVSQKALGAKLIDNIPSERGLFNAPDNLKLSLLDSNPHSVADYLTNLVHEYLHYASYVDNDHKLNNPFFEEGLTEFYARKIIADKLHIQTNLGYPVLNIIFTKLAKNLPDSDLLEIYFTKNEPALIKLIDRVYGQNFYQNNANLFLAIQSTNNRQQLLPLANLLMTKIKGQPLTESDLISTFSSY